jgi:hypothetical protein
MKAQMEAKMKEHEAAMAGMSDEDKQKVRDGNVPPTVAVAQCHSHHLLAARHCWCPSACCQGRVMSIHFRLLTWCGPFINPVVIQ